MDQLQFKTEILPLRQEIIPYVHRFFGNQDDVEDILQEVFLKLWSMKDKLPEYDNVPALSMTMAKHLCLNRLKVLYRVQDGVDETIADTENRSPHYQLEQKDNLEHVMQIINRLPDMQQMVLKMKHVDGYEVEEIADLTGSSPDAIRMNISRARKRVKELFQKM